MLNCPHIKVCLSLTYIPLRAGPSSLTSGKWRNGKEPDLLKLRMKKNFKPERMSKKLEYS